MISFLSRVHLRIGHVSDETLASFISGELSPLRAMRVNTHLGRCWQCRGRRDELERAALLVVEYRRSNLASCLPLDSGYRRSFLAKVEESTSKHGTVMPRFRSIQLFRRLLRAMNPVFASVVVLAVCGVLLFWIWQRSTATVSAQELLQLAEASEREHSEQHSAGVLYQQVAVDAGSATIHHSIYRDLSGHRKTHPAPLNPAETRLRTKLEGAGVDWEQPLSARDYSQWHDRQTEIHDDVERTDKSKLTLTTKLSDGEIAEESLTVREPDFHPISREIVFRDSERVQIAELNYSILPWSAVNMALFEPLPGGSPEVVAAGGRGPVYRHLPSMDQLVSAELKTDLALSKLRTNGAEDIRVEVGESSVLVRGLVETDSRKREIEAELSRIFLVKSELQSFEQIERTLRDSSSNNSVQIHPTELQPSPLQLLMAKRNIDAASIVALSRTLTESSLIVAREAKALTAFDRRYGVDRQAINEENRALLLELKEGHLTTLLQALANEESALAPYAVDGEHRNQASSDSLYELAVTNQQLSSELISGSGNNARSGDAILLDLVSVSTQIKNNGETELTAIKNLESETPRRP